MFLGTGSYSASASSAVGLTVTGVTGQTASTTTISETGSWGDYALTATVTEAGNTVAPTGNLSFLDTSNGNSALDTVALGKAVAGITWTNPVGLTLPTNSPQAEAVGDFNGDGVPDLVLAAGGPSQRLVVFLGNADGTYTAAPAPTLPYYAYDLLPIVVADFNGDGKQDIAALERDLGVVTILLGNGDGTFTAAASPAVGSNPTQFAVGDLNGDGIPDLAVTTSSSTSLNILLGNGDGTFTAAASPTVSETPLAIVMGDFNGDGKLDLAVTDAYDDTVSILSGNGDGTFAAATTLHSGSSGTPIAVADFNGDGKLDLAVGVSGASGVGDTVSILVGNGDGTFTPPAFGQVVSSGSIPSIQVGDFNADGLPDVVLADSTSGSFTAFLNKGGDSFTATTESLPAGSTFGLSFAAGDLNGDGRTDLVFGVFGSDIAPVYLTQPTETATATANVSLTGVGQHLVNASYGGDGNYSSSTSSTLSLWGVLPATTTSLSLTSNGKQITSAAPDTPVTLTATVAAGASPVTTGQVNFCDASAASCTDIHLIGSAALSITGTATFKFVPGAGTHSYKAMFVEDGYGQTSSSPAMALTIGPAPAPTYSDAVAISQLGAPGDYSLTATVTGYGGSALPTGNISFLDTSFGNAVLGTAPLGTSSAGTGWLISPTPAAGANPQLEVTGDFNGDGIPDLAVFSTGDSENDGPYTITILTGKGDGTFAAGTAIQATGVQSTPYMLAGDFNGDGKTDLAILSWSDLSSASEITTLLGNGDGTFAAPKTNPAYNQGVVGGDFVPGTMVAADFNGDGKLDLAVVGEYVSSGGVAILLGNGDGTFTAKANNLEPSKDFGRVAAGDFNGDGIPDLAVTNYFEDGTSPTIFLGKGDGTFTPMTPSLTLDYFPTSIATGDFNGDGILDLAFSDLNGVEITLGKGDGTFTETSASPIAVPSELYSLKVGDFNHDGKLDLVGMETYSDQIVVLSGAGDGTFTVTATSSVINQSLPNSASLVTADFNEDGVPDVAVINNGVSTASILLTEPTQTATATVSGLAPVGAGTHNVQASYPGDSNYSSATSATVALTAGLAPLVVTPSSGTYSKAQTVTISESVPGATIYYAAYGAVNTNGFVPYTGPIQLNEGGAETIEAYATETGYQQTDYAQLNYTIVAPAAPAPVFSPASGNYPGTQTVTISDTVAGASIYYTTNGTAPGYTSTPYTGPVTVSSSSTLTAFAIAPGYSASTSTSAQYLIDSSMSSFIYTIAGNGVSSYSGDGGLATVASLNYPDASVLDAAGNLYIADTGNNVVRKVAAGSHIITTIAGNGTPGYLGDGGSATSAELNLPSAVALDSAGNLYIADSQNSVIRKVAASTGIITTYAGNGTTGYGGDGGPATSAALENPEGIAIDSAGNLYIADTGNSRVRKVDGSGMITTIAGVGTYGYSGDGGPAIDAAFEFPAGLAIDSAGNLYIADSNNNVVREVNSKTGVISTVAGSTSNYSFYSGDGGPATSASLRDPQGLAVDATGNLYIADWQNSAIRKVTASTGIITTVAGNGSPCQSLGVGDGGPANTTEVCYPRGVSVDGSGNLYVADTDNNRIREVTVASIPPTASTPAPSFSVSAGSYAGPQSVTISDSNAGAAIYVTVDGSPVTTLSAIYNGPITTSGTITIQAMAVAPGYLPSNAVTATYTITTPPTAVITTVAGNGVYGSTGAGGPATGASIGSPGFVVADTSGNVYFSDYGNNLVWKISAGTGTISIVAGNGTAGYSGDGGAANNAQLNYPLGLAVDSAGNLYIADYSNNAVRMVSASTGLITTFAGTGPNGVSTTNNGDGGAANAARLYGPIGLAMDGAGNLYIADSQDYRVRRVTAKTGIISTVAGNGNYTISGDGGLATAAGLGEPSALAIDTAGNLYIADPYPGFIRKVAAATGDITTVAGRGIQGASGDGGLATDALIDPVGLAVDSAGNLYLSNYLDTVREVSAKTGEIATIAGIGYPGYSGDGGSSTVAELFLPQGIAFDTLGNLYIADTDNYRVRKVTFSGSGALLPADAPVFSVAPGTYTGNQTVSITDAAPGATIYYTADGTTPTTASTVYAGAITITQTETLKAIAVASGYAQSAVATATYTIRNLVSPTVTVTLSASSISTTQPLTVTAVVSGGSGNAVPTGGMTLSSGSYQAQETLASGSATFNLPAGTLSAGNDTLTATYAPDANSSSIYSTASQTSSVIVTAPIGTAVATLTLTPSSTNITDQQGISVAVSLTAGSGQTTPTGSVSIASGTYTASQTLTSGSTTFAISAGVLSAGANTLTATYSGDATYGKISGNTSITVSPVVVDIQAPASVSPGSSTTAAVTLSAGANYSGTMNLSCALTASPSGAQSLPTCSLSPTAVTLAAGGTSSTVLTIHTTAASTTALVRPFGPKMRWLDGGGVALAAMLFFGIPAKRRHRFSALVLLIAMLGFGIVGCGGGNNQTTTPPPSSTPATTAGNYTFTVTGSDQANANVTTSAAVVVTVQM